MSTTTRALSCVDDKAVVPAGRAGTELPRAKSGSSSYQVPARAFATPLHPSQTAFGPAVSRPTAAGQRISTTALQPGRRPSSVPVREATPEVHGLPLHRAGAIPDAVGAVGAADDDSRRGHLDDDLLETQAREVAKRVSGG